MENINVVKNDVKTKLEQLGFDEHKIKNALFIIEEIFLLYNSDVKNINYEIGRNKKELYIKISIPGEKLSLRQLEEDNNIFIFDKLINKTNFYVKQEYIEEKNIITLSLEKYFTLINNVKFSLGFLNTEKKELFYGYFYNIIAIIVNIFIPIFTGKLILAYTNSVFKQVAAMAIAIFMARILYLFFISKAGICYNTVSFDLSNTLQTTLLNKLFSITDEALEKNGSGQLIRRINNDVNEISIDITSLFNMISNGLYYLGILVASLMYDKYIFIAEVITFIGLYFLEKYRIKVLETNRRKVLNAEEKHSSLVLEQIYGTLEVKLLNASKYFIKKTKESANNVAELSKKSNRSKTKLSFINNTYIYFCYLLIMIYLGYAIDSRIIGVADALILFNYFTIISTPLVALVQRYMNFKKTFSMACERCYNLLEGNEFAKEISGNYILSNPKGRIEFKNVTFAYDTEPNAKSIKILNNVSFVIEPGKTTAIVGKSGEGKSTILRLITGQRNCGLGTIEIDGIDILKINKTSLRDNMSVISQSPFFFNASIKENLLLAKQDATDDEIIQACINAYIYDDIMETENGFDTIINEKGNRFSGGQKQRLAIARALLTSNKIIIFDEATSALDNIAQDKIMRAIKKIEKDHTIILVAHRLSTVVNSDNILMISKGKIVCQGTHKELMKNSKEYKELYTTEYIK